MKRGEEGVAEQREAKEGKKTEETIGERVEEVRKKDPLTFLTADKHRTRCEWDSNPQALLMC